MNNQNPCHETLWIHTSAIRNLNFPCVCFFSNRNSKHLIGNDFAVYARLGHYLTRSNKSMRIRQSRMVGAGGISIVLHEPSSVQVKSHQHLLLFSSEKPSINSSKPATLRKVKAKRGVELASESPADKKHSFFRGNRTTAAAKKFHPTWTWVRAQATFRRATVAGPCSQPVCVFTSNVNRLLCRRVVLWNLSVSVDFRRFER